MLEAINEHKKDHCWQLSCTFHLWNFVHVATICINKDQMGKK